jgi:hypothetical protein
MPFDSSQKLIAANWIIAYIATFAFSMTVFMYTAPWLGSQPIEELPTSNLDYNPPPAEIQTFWNNHGQAVYSKRGLISEEPVKFGLCVIALYLGMTTFQKVARRATVELEKCQVPWADLFLIVPALIAMFLAFRLQSYFFYY